MKIVTISDTHNKLDLVDVPEGDILIHAGDFTNQGTEIEVREFLKHFKKLPHQYKLFVAGNHDFLFQRKESWLMEELNNLRNNNIFYLEDSFIMINNLKFYGSPHSPKFGYWAFMKQKGQDIRKVWERVPLDINVLITHSPPYEILDLNKLNMRCGCEELKRKVGMLKDLKLHVFGHIHTGNGIVEKKGTVFINASICNDNNRVTFNPIVYELHLS